MEVYMLQVFKDYVPNSRRQLFFSSLSSFAGILVAIPLSLMVFSATQPASAKPQAQTSDQDNYALYEKAFAQGYVAHGSQLMNSSTQDDSWQPAHDSCTEPSSSEGSVIEQQATATTQTPNTHMSAAEWKQTVNNSYNTYATNTANYTKNIDSNNIINSQNTSSNTVTVNDSKGVVVSANSTINGNTTSETTVKNDDSNNDTTINDSHDTAITHTTNTTTTLTDNSTTVKDSYNGPVTTTTTNTIVKENDNHQGPNPHDHEEHKA